MAIKNTSDKSNSAGEKLNETMNQTYKLLTQTHPDTHTKTTSTWHAVQTTRANYKRLSFSIQLEQIDASLTGMSKMNWTV